MAPLIETLCDGGSGWTDISGSWTFAACSAHAAFSAGASLTWMGGSGRDCVSASCVWDDITIDTTFTMSEYARRNGDAGVSFRATSVGAGDRGSMLYASVNPRKKKLTLASITSAGYEIIADERVDTLVPGETVSMHVMPNPSARRAAADGVLKNAVYR